MTHSVDFKFLYLPDGGKFLALRANNSTRGLLSIIFHGNNPLHVKFHNKEEYNCEADDISIFKNACNKITTKDFSACKFYNNQVYSSTSGFISSVTNKSNSDILKFNDAGKYLGSFYEPEDGEKN